MGLGASYGLPGRDVERAFERGIRYFLWASLRRRDFGRGLRRLGARHREEMVIGIQTFWRRPSLMPWSVDRALRALDTDYVDILCLAWWNGAPPDRLLDQALAIRDKGKVRQIMISCHQRPMFEQFIDDRRYDAIMVRYNAAHPGAEREVFPFLASAPRRPAVVSFTATRWGSLLDSKFTPEGIATPRASDCYRFVLTNPNVDMCMTGAKTPKELDEAFVALDRGPMDEDEIAWMKKVGVTVRSNAKQPADAPVFRLADRIATYEPPWSR